MEKLAEPAEGFPPSFTIQLPDGSKLEIKTLLVARTNEHRLQVHFLQADGSAHKFQIGQNLEQNPRDLEKLTDHDSWQARLAILFAELGYYLHSTETEYDLLLGNTKRLLKLIPESAPLSSFSAEAASEWKQIALNLVKQRFLPKNLIAKQDFPNFDDGTAIQIYLADGSYLAVEKVDRTTGLLSGLQIGIFSEENELKQKVNLPLSHQVKQDQLLENITDEALLALAAVALGNVEVDKQKTADAFNTSDTKIWKYLKPFGIKSIDRSDLQVIIETGSEEVLKLLRELKDAPKEAFLSTLFTEEELRQLDPDAITEPEDNKIMDALFGFAMMSEAGSPFSMERYKSITSTGIPVEFKQMLEDFINLLIKKGLATREDDGRIKAHQGFSEVLNKLFDEE